MLHLLTNSCVNRQLRRELRAFRRSEVSLSFELERVLDRNIGIGAPETGAVPMRILRGVYGEGKRNYEYSVEFFCVNLFFTPLLLIFAK